MGNFISLTPWSHLLHYHHHYQHNKRKKVSLRSEYNPRVAATEHRHILSQGRKSLWIWAHRNVPAPEGKVSLGLQN